MTSLPDSSVTEEAQPPSGRRWGAKRISLVLSAILCACLVFFVLLPTPIVESFANDEAPNIARCGRISGLSVHLHSWPVVGRVLFGGGLAAHGHADEVTTSTYTVHDVAFSARSVDVNRTALVGSDVHATVGGLTATGVLTNADLTRTVRMLSRLPIDITGQQDGTFSARVRLGIVDVSVPVKIRLSGSKVEISSPLPVIGQLRLLVSPPPGITLRKLTVQPRGLRVEAELRAVNTQSVLCNPLTSTRS